MRHNRLDIISAAKNCLRDTVKCPRKCPLIKEENCQKFIFREAIRMYDEMKGRVFDGEDESVCQEEETQEET